MSCLKDVPGCRLNPQGLNVPHTAWMLSAFEELYAACNQRLPALPSAQWVPWDPTRKLYPFQLDGCTFLQSETGALLCDEMGLGKTTQAAVAAESIRRFYERPVCIIGPLMVRDTWRRELLAVGAIASVDEFCAVESRDFDHESFQRSDAIRYYFVHFDIAIAWWSQLIRRPFSAVIVDEAHWVKNSKAKRTRGTLMISAAAKRRLLLTGTPLDNRVAELWSPLSIATGARTWGSPIEFRRRYAGAQRMEFGWQDTVPTHTEELQQRMEPFYLRRTVEEVGLELPALQRRVQLVELSDANRKSHDELFDGVDAKKLVRAVMQGVVDEVLPVLTALRKITSRGKFQATVDYVNNLLDQGTTVLVSCWERATALRLHNAFNADLRFKMLVTGDLDPSKRTDVIDRFQQIPQRNAGVLTATLGAVREGVTLTRARVVVIHDLDWVFTRLLQLEKRIHRIGQSRACQSVWMLAADSADTLLAEALLHKAELAKEVLGIDAGAEAIDALRLDTFVPGDTVDEEVERALAAWRAT